MMLIVALNNAIIQLFVKENQTFVKTAVFFRKSYRFFITSLLKISWFKKEFFVLFKFFSKTYKFASDPAIETSSFFAIIISKLD